MPVLRPRAKLLIALGALACVGLAVACAVFGLERRRTSRREAFVASVLEEARSTRSCSFEPLSINVCSANVRTVLQLLAAYGEKNVIIDPSIRGEPLVDIDGVPLSVALDAIALDQNAVVRTSSEDLLRIDVAPVALDGPVLDELSAKLEADRPLTMRARSLIAAIALHRGHELPEGLLSSER
ncbi:MAG: hypothetical protein ACAI25_03305 [Planctomycetota bacterium]